MSVALAQTLTTVYNFAGGSDGIYPNSGIVLDGEGNLYGPTSLGGVYGYGTVFKVSADGTEKVLFSFRRGASQNPGGLIRDAQGNLYGVTTGYHRPNSKACYGTVFELTNAGKKKSLYCFKDPTNGAYPSGPLIQDSLANLYGTTMQGGAYGYGTVFKVTPKPHRYTVLLNFVGQQVDGAGPRAGVTMDGKGNLFGTTTYGGTADSGTVFELAASGHYSTLYSFSYSGAQDGNLPMAPLLLDSNGNLVGTTGYGGEYGFGTVFKFATTGEESILHSFNQLDGQLPVAGLVQDASGNFYGTTASGGAFGGNYGYGTIFKISSDGVETVLYNFTGGADGANPEAGLTWDENGNLYGTTKNGGSHGYGTVFKLTP